MQFPVSDGLSQLGYYVFCAAFFVICGLISGYFIWRKGHMQTLDAESEIHRTAVELEKLSREIKKEETLLAEAGDPGESGKKPT